LETMESRPAPHMYYLAEFDRSRIVSIVVDRFNNKTHTAQCTCMLLRDP